MTREYVPIRGVANVLDYIRLTPGPGFQPINAALYYGQRLITHGGARNVIAKVIAAAIQRQHPESGAETESADQVAYRRQLLTTLTTEGCGILGPVLQPSSVREIHDFLHDKNLVPDSGMAAYPLATILTCPHLLELANRPLILKLAAAHLGCKPTISSIGLRWSYPTLAKGADVQQFHRDPDDWRFLKFFVYLTDVGPESGPHIFVVTSHRSEGGMFARPYAKSTLEHDYGADKIRTIVGGSGTGFIALTAFTAAPCRSTGRA